MCASRLKLLFRVDYRARQFEFVSLVVVFSLFLVEFHARSLSSSLVAL